MSSELVESFGQALALLGSGITVGGFFGSLPAILAEDDEPTVRISAAVGSLCGATFAYVMVLVDQVLA
jgi:hypothetical protein